MSVRNKPPFTEAQWQELEHQALIFKYMVSGIPIPPDLLFTFKTNYFDSRFASNLFPPPNHQHAGWNYLQMGLGRKIDPEPGRCKRTDGKKWRCSKEAYPDSKYCERHMHRGKNRSRKPVEVFKTTKAAPQTNLSIPPMSSSITKRSPSTLYPHSSDSHHQLHHYLQNPSHYQQHRSSSRPLGIFDVSGQDPNISLLLDSGSYCQSNPDFRNRCVYGVKDDVDEHTFFSEPCGTMRGFSTSSTTDNSWQFTPLTMSSSSSSSKQRSCSGLQSEEDYSCLQLQSLSDTQKHQNRDEHCLAMEKCLMPTKMVREEPQKTIHLFFDEWPPKDRESWLDLDDKSSNNVSVSTTQLSISIPTSSHDSIFNSKIHNGE